MIEIYKENLYDMLNPYTKPSCIKIKEDPRKGMIVENLSDAYIESKKEFLLLLDKAAEYRSVSETYLNKYSSRSHIIFILTMTQKFKDNTEKRSILNLVDLAGSEKVQF